MATIRLCPTVYDMQKNTKESTSAGQGFNEQWLKELEQAHLQHQVSAMRPKSIEEAHSAQTSSAPRASMAWDDRRSIDAPCGEGPTGYPHIIHTNDGHYAVERMDTTAGIQGLPKKASSGPLQVENPVCTLYRAHTCSSDRKGTSCPGPVDLGAADPCYSIERSLPPEHLITAINTDEGMHIFIRDVYLESFDAQRVIEKLRGALHSQKKRLLTVTLNGECVWKIKEKAGTNIFYLNDQSTEQRFDSFF